MINIIKAIRLHHWIKNLLVFLPFIAANQSFSVSVFQKLFFGFLSFSLCASAGYIINDILDLKNDRKHITKKHRPLVSGKISIKNGWLIAAVLIFFSFFVALKIENNYFVLFLIFYFILSLSYSLFFKKIILVDCIALTILYSVRIFAGSVIVNIFPSFWFITFSIFIFLSLAFLKRYVEIPNTKNKQIISGRDYYSSDKLLVKILGINSGYISVLILALYLNSDIIIILYQDPKWMWGIVISFLFWVNWIWLKAHRNLANDDPVIFIIKDKASILTFVLLTIFFILARY